MQGSELKRILTSIGDKMSAEEAQEVLDGVENSYGNVNYEGKRDQIRFLFVEFSKNSEGSVQLLIGRRIYQNLLPCLELLQ